MYIQVQYSLDWYRVRTVFGLIPPLLGMEASPDGKVSKGTGVEARGLAGDGMEQGDMTG